MGHTEIGIWVTGTMLVFVLIGVRVAFAAALAGFVGLIWIFSAKLGLERGFMVAVKMAGTIPHSKVSSLALSLIPAFILIGFLAYHAGLTRSLFEAAKRWVGWLPGGMGVATVFSAESAFGLSAVGVSIWFGIIVVKMAELCLITPPIGLNCFVVAGVRPECSVQDVFRGVAPFFAADVATIGVLIALPQIVLWLPAKMGFT